MRTTIDLPPELMRAAEIAATERGLSLAELFTKALEHEVGAGIHQPKSGRARFPLVGAADAPRKVDSSIADIAEALGNDDAAEYT